MAVKKAIGTAASKAKKSQPAKFQFSGSKGNLASKGSALTKMLQNATKSAEALQKARESAFKEMDKNAQRRENAKKKEAQEKSSKK